MKLMLDKIVLVLVLWVSASGAVLAQDINSAVYLKNLPWVNVRDAGAAGDGISDDTDAIRRAILRAPHGGQVMFPAGRYRVTQPIVIDKPLALTGLGRGSQVFQSNPGANLFVLQAVQAASISGLYLGSASTTPGTSLILLENSHHNRIDNVTLLGGYYGVHLRGSLLNALVGVRSGTNFQGFFGAVSTNQYWVYAERFNSISANANTFVHPALEGGTHGIRIEDTGEGSLFIYGGTIEGVSGWGVSMVGTGLPSVINGVHFEANGLGDIQLQQASRVRVQSVYATKLIEISAVSRNNTVAESLVERITIGPQVVRTRLLSNELNLSGAASPAILDQATDTQYMAVSDSINPFDWYGTLGIGARNPNSNPVGLTPNLKLDVEGTIRANAYATGDIHFYKDGKHVQRLFEDERGLYLENTQSGAVSRVILESDLSRIMQQLETLRGEIAHLKSGSAAR